MDEDFTITIHDPERARVFEELLGTTTLPIKSLIPTTSSTSEHTMASFYILDTARLDPRDFNLLARHIAEKFRQPLDDVIKEMKTNGVPILAEHFTVAIRNPLRWI